MNAEEIAKRITEIVLYQSVIFFGAVLFAMIRNKNRINPRPPLDWAFIFENSSLFLIVLWSTLVINGWFPPNPWVRVFIWSSLGISEALVLWFIYTERYGRGAFTRLVKETLGYVHTHLKCLRTRVRNSRIGL